LSSKSHKNVSINPQNKDKYSALCHFMFVLDDVPLFKLLKWSFFLPAKQAGW